MAFATLVTTENYVQGAVVIARTLRALGSKKIFVALVSQDLLHRGPDLKGGRVLGMDVGRILAEEVASCQIVAWDDFTLPRKLLPATRFRLARNPDGLSQFCCLLCPSLYHCKKSFSLRDVILNPVSQGIQVKEVGHIGRPRGIGAATYPQYATTVSHSRHIARGEILR